MSASVPIDPKNVRQVETTVGSLWVHRWDRGLSKRLRVSGEYEPEATSWLLQTLAPGMAVVDIGANIGYYTVLCARAVGDSGRVLAFEPDPSNRALLERNLRESGLEARVRIEAAAVADAEGTRRLHIDAGYLGGHSLSAANVSAERETVVQVPTTTLDQAVSRAGFSQIDFIKIDAQGAEGQILRGAAQTLGARPGPVLLLELWPFGLTNCGSSVDEVIGQLRQWGFGAAKLVRKKGGPVSTVAWPWAEIEAEAAQASGHNSLNLVLTK